MPNTKTDLRDQLYDNLIGSGRVSENEIGSREDFKSAITDKYSALQFHKNLIDAGVFDESDIGSADDFYNSISNDFVHQSAPRFQADKPITKVPQAQKEKDWRDVVRKAGFGVDTNWRSKAENEGFGVSDANIPDKLDIAPTLTERNAKIQEEGLKNAQGDFATRIDARIAELEKERSKYVDNDGIPHGFGTNLYQAGLGAPVRNKNNDKLTEIDLALDDLRAAKRRIESAGKMKESSNELGGIGHPFTEKGRADFLNNWKNFGYGVWDTLHDRNLYDLFGVGELRKAGKYLEIKNKVESGEELSDNENTLVVAGMLNAAAQEYDVPGGYSAGVTTTEMAPFMIQMVANPGSGIGKAVARKAVRQFGKSGIKAVAARVAGRVLGNVGEAAVLSNTLQAGSTAADVLNRMTGTPSMNEKGEVTFSDSKDALTAIYQGEVGSIIENFTELGTGGGLNKVLQKAATSGVGEKLGLAYINDLVTKVGATPFARGMKQFADKVHWDGLIEEPMEEEYGIILNSILGSGNSELSDLWDAQKQKEIWAGTMWFGGLLSGMNTAAYPMARHNAKKRLDIADSKAQSLLGEAWQSWKERIDQADDYGKEGLPALMDEVAGDNSLSQEKKVALLDYASRLKQYQGANVGDMLARMEDTFGKEKQDIRNSYDAGYDAEGSAMADVTKRYEQSRENLRGYLSDENIAMIDDSPIENLDYFLNAPTTDESKAAILEYVNAKAALDGLTAKIGDNIDTQIAASDAEIDARVNQQSGVIVPAVMKNDNRQVYVVSGDVVMMQDGSGVDREKSSQNIIVRDAQTGELEFATPTDILGIDEAMNPNELKTQAALDIQGRVTAAANAQIAGLPTFALNDALVLNTPQGQMSAVVTDEINADGLITVQVGNPYDGTARSLQFSPEELSGMVMSVNGKEVEKPSEDVTPKEGLDNDIAENTTTATETQPAKNGAMPMIGEGEDAEPDFMQVEPTRARRWIAEESGLSGAEASMFVDAKVKEAQEEVKKAQKGEPKFGDKNVGTSISKYNRLHGEWQAQMDAAQAMVDYWQAVKDEQQAINNAERQEQLNSEVAAAQQAEEKRQAEVMAEKKAQQELGSNNVAPAIREKWDAAEKVEGVRNELVLANGERVPGRYVMVESGAATASHDALNGFAKSAGFPVDANEQSVNDRDYERDKDAQEITRGIAAKYDSRALQTPVVVSSDGVVLSGNGRTMAGELAARDNTDAAYIDYLKQYGEQYGFSAEQVESMQHPRVLFVPDNAMPYTAETFAKFNQQEMKGQSKTEQAVKLGKVVSDDVALKIMQAINGYESLNEFYADTNAATGAIRELLKSGVISQAQYAEMFDGDTLSSAGKEFIENVLIGKFFGSDSDTIRKTTAYKSLRQAVVTAMAEIGNNIMLGEDYFLHEELAQAIDLVYRARKAGYKAGDKVSEFATQGNLFSFDEGSSVADINNVIALVLADVMNDGRISRLKKVLSLYNDKAKESANGQVDMFAGIRTKEDIFNEIKQLLNYGTNEQQQQAIDNAKEKRTNQSQADGGGSKGTEPTAASGASSTGDGVEGGNGIAGEGTEQGGRLKSSVMAARAGDKKAQQELANFGIAWEKKPVVRFVAEGEVNSLLGGGRYMGRFGNGRVDVTNSTSPTTAATADYRITFKDRDDLDWSLSDRLRMKNEELGDGYIMDGYSLDDVATIEKKNEDGSYTTIYTAKGTEQGVDAAVAVAEQETEQEPTEGQKEAGNYKKGHVRIDGYEISIENPKGSVRRGTDASGKAWEQTMQNTYGYIRGTEGVDGDHIDVFLSDHLDDWNGNVYVIDQVDQFNTFDEHKVMYGFNSEEEARAAYLSNYEKGWQGLGAITEVSKEEFKKWVESSHRKTKAFAEYKSVKGLDNGIAENTTAATETQPAEKDVERHRDYVAAFFSQIAEDGENFSGAAEDLRDDEVEELYKLIDDWEVINDEYGRVQEEQEKNLKSKDEAIRNEAKKKVADAREKADKVFYRVDAYMRQKAGLRDKVVYAIENSIDDYDTSFVYKLTRDELLELADLIEKATEAEMFEDSEEDVKVRNRIRELREKYGTLSEEEKKAAENGVKVETSADGKTTTYYTKQGNKAFEVTEFNKNKLLVDYENLITTKEETRDASSEIMIELNKLGKWAENPYGWRIPKDKKAELDRVLREHLDKLPQKGEAPYNPETEERLGNSVAENTTAATETQPAENGGYTISDTTYTNKKGKTTAMHLVKFDRELTSDELRAGKELAKESRGWWDREKDGFMMRDAESAKALAESLNDDEKVEDAQPLSADDMATAADASVSAEDKQKRREEERDKALAAHGVKIGDEIWYKGEKATIFDADEKYVTLDTGMSPVIYEQVEWQDVTIPQTPQPAKVNVESLMGELNEKGEAKLSDHVEKERLDNNIAENSTTNGSKWVDDADAARFEELRKRLKAKLNGQLNLGIDPEAFAIGVEMSYLVLKHGARKIAEYAKAMIDALGDEVRPYIKSFYNGARDLPEMAEYESELTPYDEVRAFDVANFDKVNVDAMATAEQVIKEQDVAQQAEVATDKLKKERNENRKAAMVANDGTPLRKATEADFEKADTEVYYNGEKYGVVAIMRTTEQTDSPMHFSYPAIKSVYLTNMQDVPLKDLYVADEGKPAEEVQGTGETAAETQPAEKKGKKVSKKSASGQLDLFGISMSELQPAEKKKPKTPWWSDDKRPQSLNPDDYRTYMTDEAKEYFAQFEFKYKNDNKGFKAWTHPELAFITAAAWDGANIPVEVLMQIPEIQEAEVRVEKKNSLPDFSISEAKENELQDRLLDAEHGSAVFENGKIRKIDGKKEDFTGAVRQEKKAFVVVGRPAGGKSSVFANRLSNENSARVVDSDTVKPWLDGFDDGYGAGYVQDVSAKIANLALNKASDNGDNIVLPRIGGKSVMKEVIMLREKGYDVQIYYNEVSEQTSIMRAASRFAEEGRYLSLEYLTKINSKDSYSFRTFVGKTIKYYYGSIEESRSSNRSASSDDLLVGRGSGYTEGTQNVGGREGERVSGVVQDGLRTGEHERAGQERPSGTFGDELIFSYAEWKSNDVSFGEKPKEIWNSRSGKPMPTEGKNVKDYGNGRTIQSSSSQVLPGEPNRESRPDDGRERAGLQDGRNDGGRNGEVTISSPNGDGGRSEVQSSERPSRYVSQLSNTEPRNLNNNHAERGKDYAPKGVDARIAANIRAIELMQKLIESGTPASAAQKAILRQYSGWGGLGKAFNDSEIDKQLRDLLGAEAYEQAQKSRYSAYYTPAMIIDSMWDVAKALGFNGGNVLEGSAGIGNIIGAMPREMSEHSNIHAVEIDQTTGNILSLLYPDAKVDIQGFEATEVENGSIDLAITNVPFVTGLPVKDTTGDKDLSKKFRDIHDFCIAKNVRKLREGGIGIFITSNGTLDKSTKLREWIVRDGGADVIGAFRLNNETFGGTGVTSDIIVIRKRVNGKKSPYAIDVLPTTAVRVEDYDTGEEKKVKGKYVPVIKRLTMDYNKYFVEHPEMMGGEMKFAFEEGNTYRPESKGLYPVRGKSQEKLLSEWVKSFEGKGLGYGVAENSTAVEPQPAENLNEVLGDGVKEGSLVIDSKGKLCIAQRGKAVPLNVNANKVKGHTKEECFKAYKAIKTALADVLNYQTENKGDEGLPKLLAALNKAYDDFVRTYGHLHKNTAISFLRNDVDFSNILALETYSETKSKDGKITQNFGKTDVFKGRVIEKEVTPEPESVKDAVIDSVHAFGRIDIPWMTERLQVKQPGITESQVKEEILSGKLGYEDPTTKEVIVAYEYLSGNVREKLQQAKDNNTDGRYNDNITALDKVVPMDIPAHLIEFNLGSSWIDPKVYEDYVLDRTGVQVSLINAGGTWVMKAPDYVYTEQNKGMGVYSKVFEETIFGTELIAAAIQNRTINVSKTRKKSNGETETIKDPDATAACAQKIDEIRSDFRDWARAKMQSDSELAAKMERVYNDTFNYYAPKEIGEEFIPEYFPGANRKIKLQPHQAKAAINGTTQPLMLAHEVGSGKTFTMITTAMEMRRLGTARKPMLVVQNATVGQIVESAKFLYPNSKVLTIEEADRTPEGRRNFYAKIKYNDWDMIIVPQSVFERIPDSIERQIDYVKMKMEEKMITLEKMREQEDSHSTFVKQTEHEIEALEDELAGLSSELVAKKSKKRDGKKEALTKEKTKVKALEMLDRETDDVEDFDDMGIDAILVDEAHEYKHLGFATAMQRGVKGIDPSYSKKSQGVYLKTQAVLEKSNGKNVIFATGTPISNTAAEIWTFMRYLMPAEKMQEYGIYYFDDFVRNFGRLEQNSEFTTSGKWKEVNRFLGYVNIPELVRIWAEVTDTVLNKDVEAARKERGEEDKLPKLENGKAEDIFLPQTKALRSIMLYVKRELDNYDHMTAAEKKRNSHIPLTMYGIAKAAAVDARLVDADAADEPQSKTNEAVRQTLRSLEETKSYKGTIALFADNYQNKRSGFNLYEDIRKKLIEAGVPAEQIVVITSNMSVKKKLEIFDKVNKGEIRVIMGSTFTLGTGVNIQERLHTLIHIDAPNRPMDYIQREGRMVRQGNLHKEWGIPVRELRFGVEDSLDVTAYQRLKTKKAIVDAIMNGKKLMANSMENRVLEEEEDVFGDTVAQLSGSEYAMLRNQAERDVRKYEAKKKQWEADQVYCHNQIPATEKVITHLQEMIEENKANLAKVEAIEDKTTIVVGKQKFANVAAMADFIKEYNKALKEVENKLREDRSIEQEVRKLSVNIGGIDFEFTTTMWGEYDNNAGGLFRTIRRKMVYRCPALGIDVDVPCKQALLREGLEDIEKNVMTGNDFRENIEGAQAALERDRKNLEQLKERYGKPFAYSDELEQAHKHLDEYTELMTKELEEKEKKYAAMDAEVEIKDDVDTIEEDDEEEEILSRESDEDEGLIRRVKDKLEEKYPGFTTAFDIMDFDGVPELFFGDKVAAVALYNKQYPNANAKINKAGDIEGKFHYPILIWGVQEFESAMKEVSKDGKLPGVLSDYVQDAMEMAEAGREEIIHSDNFKKFFGDWEKEGLGNNIAENSTTASKVVDADGKPMIVYHSTNLTANNNGKPFWVFNAGSHFGTSGQADEILRTGRRDADLSKVYPVYLNIRNPKRVSDTPAYWEETHSEWWEKQIAQAKKEGYDGIVYLNKYEDKEHPADSWIAFYPQQIKSATENVGTFDAENEDIRLREEDAPVFISNAMRAVEQVKQEKATGDQWIAMLQKAGGLKAGEDKWLGLSDWLKGKKSVTKQEVLDYIQTNQIEVEDVWYSEGEPTELNNKIDQFKQEFEECMAEAEEETNSVFVADHAERAFDMMVDRYGDDFREAFDIQHLSNGVYTIEPRWDWNDELSSAAKYYLDYDKLATKPINSTRLDYTTEGLKNKREVALVVPNIESWNESDDIHFGDAGNGRAVAWVRFGDTDIYHTTPVVKHIDKLQEPWDNGRGMLLYYPEGTKEGWDKDYIAYGKIRTGEMKYVPTVNEKYVSAHDTLEEALNAMNEYYETHPEAKKQHKKVLVIDEIQSKRHQEGREHGYNRDLTQAESSELENLERVYDELQKQKEQNSRNVFELKRIHDEESKIIIRLQELENIKSGTGIPDAPFDKNWHELAMKRMLRYAAENGYDKVAWTTGEQQAERYNLSKELDKLSIRKNADGTYNVEGIRKGSDELERFESNVPEENLANVVGKDIAKQAIEYNGVRFELEGDGLRIGGEGMKGFYDQILPRFMNKYGKKWGVKVEDVSLPEIGQTMHSVDVTSEMKESVMEGQTLFRMREDEAPKKTGVGYKVFVVRDGQLYPPMVANPNGEATPVGVWLDADAAPVAGTTKTGRKQVKAGGKGTQGGSGKLAYRPGWHLGEIPYALQFNRVDPVTGEKSLFPANFVWAEVEYANDVDYQDEAMSYGRNANGNFQHSLAGLPRVPENGSYKYRTNPDPKTDAWVITGAVKVNRILKPSEVDEIVRAAGREPQIRQEGAITDEQVERLNERLEEMSREGEREPMTMVTTRKTKRYTRAQQQAFAERQLQRKRKAAEDTARKLNILDDVIIVDNIDEAVKTVPEAKLTGKQMKARGWYRTKAGKIVIILGNHRDVSDVVVTMLHESVAHYGLRKLFGKNFDTFLDNVFNAADEDVRRRIVDLAKAKDWNFRRATEEYLASLAEDMNFEGAEHSGWWQKIKRFFMNMLRQIGVRVYDDYKGTGWISDNELRYILWRSYENLAEPGMYRNPFNVAEDVVMQSKLGVGNFAEIPVGEPQGTVAAETLYSREGEEDINDTPAETEAARVAHDIYEDAVSITGNSMMITAFINSILKGKKGWEQFKHQFAESWFDYSRSIKALQDAIEKATGKAIAGFEDVWKTLNAKPGVDMVERNEVQDKYISPMAEYIGSIIKNKKIDGKEVTLDDVEKYLNAVHGQERNVAMAIKQAQDEYDRDTELTRKQLENPNIAPGERKSLSDSLVIKEARFKGVKNFMDNPVVVRWWKDWNQSVERAHNNGTMSDADYKKVLSQMQEEYNQGWQYKYREKDYSGLTALFRDDFPEDEEVTEEMLEQAARDYAAKFEEIIGKEECKKMWQYIDRLNSYSLRKSYLSGLINKQQYDDTLSMYEHYVPLRGWHDDYAGDIYQYISRGEPTEVLQRVLKKAYGRKSRAARIFGTMAAMANSAIVQGNKNLVAQKFLNMAINHTDAGLLMVTEQWYQKDANGNLVPQFPNLREDMTVEEMQDEIVRFQAEMQEREERGEVEQLRKKFKKEMPLNMSKWQEQHHAIRVLRNGREYMVYILGNPRAAEAFNGLLNPYSQPGVLSNILSRYMRFRAKWQTSLSPEFLISNFQRDVMTATIGAYIKFGKETAEQFTKNLAKVMPLTSLLDIKKGKMDNPTGIFSLFKKYENGTLNKGNEMERYFDEFVRNGGMTGISYITRSEEYQASMEDVVKRIRQGKLSKPRQMAESVGEIVEFTNKGIENATRFAMYMTSRQQGKNVVDSIFDAKEASVNFNMKGSGAWGNMMARRLYLYVNPSMQALRMVGTWYENDPVITKKEGAKIATKYVGKRFMKTVSFILATSAATAIVNILLSSLLGHGDGDDDDDKGKTDWWALSEWNRYNYINFINPFGKGYFHWSIPQELRPIWAIGQIAVDTMFGKITAQHGLNSMLSQLNNLTPLSFFEGGTTSDESTISSLIRTFTPSFVSDFTDAYGWNRNFLGSWITNQNSWNEDYPEWQRAGEDTPKWMVHLSKEWNDFAPNGRTNNRSKFESRYVNPSAIYYIMTQQFGGVGSMVKRLNQLVEQVADSDKEVELRNVPFVPKFYVSTGDDYSTNRITNEKFRMYWNEFKAASHELSRDRSMVKDGSMSEEEANKTIEERKADGSYNTYQVIYNNYLDKLYNALKGTKEANDIKKMIIDAVENGNIPDFYKYIDKGDIYDKAYNWQLKHETER